MTNFNEHQVRLWKKMVDFLEEYRNDKRSLESLVDTLENSLDAGEFKDQELVRNWYKFWTPLETYRAVKLDQNEPAIPEEIMPQIEAMRSFLTDKLKKGNNH